MIEVAAPSLLIEEPNTPGLSRDYVAKTYGVALDDVAKLGSAENEVNASLDVSQTTAPLALQAMVETVGLLFKE